MANILVVGSGASGVHFALSALQKGNNVTMLDVGYKKPDTLNPQNSINDLKLKLADPVDYFLGNTFEAFVSPDYDSEYYGFPPNKSYVFKKPPQFSSSSYGFAPLFSFAQGGLAEVWTGGVYPLNEQDLSDFPFSSNDLLSYYDEIANRIGISGVRDDLARFYPMHKNIMEPLTLDSHSSILLSKYRDNRHYLNNKLGFYMGRSRIATLSRKKGLRNACTYTGRCLWGCPIEALYTPSITLADCKTYKTFTYIPAMFVSHFKYNSTGRITSLIAFSTKNSCRTEFRFDSIVLAAGTLSSSKIFLESIFRKTGEIVKLTGLMDNRQVLIPFVNLKMAGKSSDSQCYQYHQSAFGIKSENPEEYVHGQVTTLKSALIHPLIKKIPFDLKTSIYIFRNFHSALGLINLNFADYRRPNNYVSLDFNGTMSNKCLLINYVPIAEQLPLLYKAIKTVRKAFYRLGCIVPPGMTYIRPMGSSVHYSGTLPMSNTNSRFTTNKYCQSRDFNNLYFVDGTTFPFLPSKNLTFTLMANAARVADHDF
jgi:GMC oxidoreductase